MPLIDLRVEYLKNPLGLTETRPRFSWKILSTLELSKRNIHQISYQIHVATTAEKLRNNIIEVWDSGVIESSQSVNLIYDGPELSPHQKYFWNVIVKDNHDHIHKIAGDNYPFWQMGLIEVPREVKWIGEKKTPKNKIEIEDTTKKSLQTIIKSNPSQYLRKKFIIDKEKISSIKNAYLYATALGEYIPYLNGERLGDYYFSPEWTDYKKRVLYQTFDVKKALRGGENRIGSILADGWYMGLLGPGDKIRQLYYGEERRFWALLHVEFENGEIMQIPSDKTWEYINEGPIRSADHFLGEEFDSNFIIDNWTDPSQASRGINWNHVFVDDSINIIIQPQIHEPVQIYKKISPIEISEPQPNEYIVDFGQNLVGFCEISLDEQNGTKGNTIVIKHGEMLNEDGTLHRENLRLALQKDTYTANGTKNQIYHPHFTFHGYRYVELTGLKDKPKLSMINSYALSSNPPLTGTMSTDSKMVNTLISNILWTQRNNMVSVPTDCPQRNERMGWMGDIYAFAQTAIFNMNMAGFLTNFCQNIRDAQAEDGRYPDFAPHPMDDSKFMNSPGWADAGIFIPWLMYVNYNDKRILERSYNSMKNYIDCMKQLMADYKYSKGNYGDWLNGDKIKSKNYPKKGAEIPKSAFATLLFARSVEQLSTIAQILHKSDDCTTYTQLYHQLQKGFHEHFVKFSVISKITGNQDKFKKIAKNTQASFALSLNFDILKDKYKEQAFNELIKNIRKKYDSRMSTGFLSTTPMLIELSERGENDLAFELLLSERLPSWGYSIKQGATTIWERWDAFVEGRGFQNRGMNSFDHYAYGAVQEWMYKEMLGIQLLDTHPGYQKFKLAPKFGNGLLQISGEYDSVMGMIKVSWKKSQTDHSINLDVEIPPNSEAELIIPDNIEKIIEKSTNKESTNLIFGSGTYSFILYQANR